MFALRRPSLGGRVWCNILTEPGLAFCNFAPVIDEETKNKLIGRLGITEKAELENFEKIITKPARRPGTRPLKNLDALLDLGMTSELQKKLVLNESAIINMRPDLLSQKWKWFKINVGFTNEELMRVIAKQPTLFTRSVEKKITPVVKFLGELGFRGEDLKSVVTRATRIFTLSLEKKVKPRVQAFKDLGFGDEELVEFLLKRPWSIEMDIVPKIEWVRQAMEVTDNKDLRALLHEHPKLLANNVGDMSSGFKYLLMEGVPRGQALELLCKQPSKPNGRLVDKVDFAKKALNKSVEDVLEWPEYITRPLYNHIALRVGFLAKEGVPYSQQPLSALFVFGDERFMEIFGGKRTPALSPVQFFEYKQWWLGMEGEKKKQHLDLLANRGGAPWRGGKEHHSSGYVQGT
ncbi:hypothetical protein BSKO_09095 [Bryopsis sp. KO-2023]|nr:hypothetical protein BSKO_09095 [Bryopsis sp. KO-2023]